MKLSSDQPKKIKARTKPKGTIASSLLAMATDPDAAAGISDRRRRPERTSPVAAAPNSDHVPNEEPMLATVLVPDGDDEDPFDPDRGSGNGFGPSAPSAELVVT